MSENTIDNENTVSDEITEDEVPTLDDEQMEAVSGGLWEDVEVPVARHPVI